MPLVSMPGTDSLPRTVKWIETYTHYVCTRRAFIQVQYVYTILVLFACENILISAYLTGEMGGYTLDLLYSRKEFQLLLFLSNILTSEISASRPGRS